MPTSFAQYLGRVGQLRFYQTCYIILPQIQYDKYDKGFNFVLGVGF